MKIALLKLTFEQDEDAPEALTAFKSYVKKVVKKHGVTGSVSNDGADQITTYFAVLGHQESHLRQRLSAIAEGFESSGFARIDQDEWLWDDLTDAFDEL